MCCSRSSTTRQWPPYPAETIEAVLIAHDLAEMQGVPWFVTNISRGDIVQVRHDGIGYVGGPVVSARRAFHDSS